MLRKAQIFQKLPPRSTTPEYYDAVSKPICLDQISQKVQQGLYASRREFIEDFSLLYRNVCAFRGRNSDLAREAADIVRKVQLALRKFREHLRL